MKLKLSSLLIASSMLALTACGGSEAEAPAEAIKPIVEAVKETPPAIEKPAAKVEAAITDPVLKRGKIVWFKCRSCHETSVDGPHKVGPNLNGLMGANAGVKEGFAYSEALVNSGIVWDAETLDAFIEKPSAYIKGTKMAFVGIKKESDRQAVIKYIEENTK